MPAPTARRRPRTRAPAAGPRRRRRARRPVRLLRRDQLSSPTSGPGSWRELVVPDGRRHGHRACSPSAARASGSSRLNAVRVDRAVAASPGRSSLMGLGTIVLDRGVKLYFHVEEIVVGCVTAWLALVAGARSTARGSAAQRKAGHFERRVMIVGTDRRAMELAELFETHPEAGRAGRRARRLGTRGPGGRALATCGWPTTPTPTECSPAPTSTASCSARATSTRRCSTC